jgi:serine/threonine-protein kinase HipA
MISEAPTEAYVWIWLPRASEPAIAGRVEAVGDVIEFNYGQSYLARSDAIPLYLPELPLTSGRISPRGGMSVAGCIADASPDAWGQRVIMNRVLGAGAVDADPADLSPLAYLLGAGSNRIGALDFQPSPSEHVNRSGKSTALEELMRAARMVEEGVPLPAGLDDALLRGSSIGGARPKALLEDDDRQLIAKFSSTTDLYPVVKGEFLAMTLAARAGLEVAPVQLREVLGKDVLLVERFDRPGSGQRKAVVSALTILELDEMFGAHASYADLADIVRQRFTQSARTLRELFSRIVFNILVGNTDDHARNHAAFWDGEALTLTPAYDICPSPRSRGEASQGMMIGPDGFRLSQLSGCIAAAATYRLKEREAREIVDHQIEVIESGWDEVCDLAGMTEIDRKFFWKRQFLNPYAFEGYRA